MWVVLNIRGMGIQLEQTENNQTLTHLPCSAFFQDLKMVSASLVAYI